MPDVFLYDTTLRDGAQTEGITFSVADKLKILTRLDEFGFHYIEGGWPGATPKDSEFFVRARDVPLRNARLAAFASTRRPGGHVESDPTVRALIDAATPVVAVVGKSWTLHVTDVLRTTLDENLAMIRDTCQYLHAIGREVVYDAEHFFDGYRADPRYALESIRSAFDGGADWLVLCDTNGGSMPGFVARVVTEVRLALPNARIGIHPHNDCECGVANALAAVEAGATQVQGTINGYGERIGNANLISIVPNLQVKMGLTCVDEASIAQLTKLSQFVAEIANQIPSPNQPYVGSTAFAHKAGLHANAVLKTSASFEHIDPALVGNRQRILISELGGRSNIESKLAQFGIDVSGDEGVLRRISAQVKEMESRGFQYEAADASFELLARRALPNYKAPFELLDVLVLVEKRRGVEMLAEATIKIRVGDAVMHTAAEGNGPVHALDGAMRKTLLGSYPELAAVELIDFKVRVVDQTAGTGTVVRVSIESSDGHATWSTVGSSGNIIEASWLALADSMEFALLRAGREMPSLATV
ncbi:MAG: citramalate synthase [Chloroflexota bacterium]|nr:MAG: citramalate synthase [Chloroflexota bacterium]